jgi:hypothetical protein
MKKKKQAAERHDRANAFLAEPETGQGPRPDDLSEYLGENFVSVARGADDADAAHHDELNIDELGGPFIETDGGVEFAGDDEEEARTPAEREAFPTAVRSDHGKGARPSVNRRP